MTVFAYEGRMWNMKLNKCKECGKENESIVAGISHLYMEHGIKTSYNDKKYLKHLEML